MEFVGLDGGDEGGAGGGVDGTPSLLRTRKSPGERVEALTCTDNTSGIASSLICCMQPVILDRARGRASDAPR